MDTIMASRVYGMRIRSREYLKSYDNTKKEETIVANSLNSDRDLFEIIIKGLENELRLGLRVY